MDNYEILLKAFNELKAKVELQNELLAKLINQSSNIKVLDGSKWGNIEAACGILKCKPRLIYRLASENKIKSSNPGGSKRHKLYDLESIKTYIENQSKLVLKK